MRSLVATIAIALLLLLAGCAGLGGGTLTRLDLENEIEGYFDKELTLSEVSDVRCALVQESSDDAVQLYACVVAFNGGHHENMRVRVDGDEWSTL